MKKKIISILLASLCISTIFVGCNNVKTTTVEPSGEVPEIEEIDTNVEDENIETNETNVNNEVTQDEDKNTEIIQDENTKEDDFEKLWANKKMGSVVTLEDGRSFSFFQIAAAYGSIDGYRVYHDISDVIPYKEYSNEEIAALVNLEEVSDEDCDIFRNGYDVAYNTPFIFQNWACVYFEADTQEEKDDLFVPYKVPEIPFDYDIETNDSLEITTPNVDGE